MDRGDKMTVYARYGVKHAWIVDPKRRTVEAFENDGGVGVDAGTCRDGEQIGLPPFDVAAIRLPWP